MAQLFNSKDPLSFFLSPANSLERAVAHPEAVLLPAIGIPLSVAHNLPFFIPHYTGLQPTVIPGIGTVVDAVEDDTVAVRLAYHHSKALTKCEGLETLFAHFLRFKGLTAIWGKQPCI